MSKKPLILGIESSCDETAASLITENEEGFPVVLSNIVSSQVEVHKEFGGVVPELAARSHIEKIDWIRRTSFYMLFGRDRKSRCSISSLGRRRSL